MNDLADNQAWYLLSRIDGLGPKRLHQIYRALSNSGHPLSSIFDLNELEFQQLLPSLAAAFYPRIKAADKERAAREFDALRKQSVEIVHLGHEKYPALLASRLGDSAPPLLYCRGAISLLAAESLAIVGSRHALAVSIDFAGTIAGENRLNIISGYAAGIDTAAHLGSLQAGGTTTIVLAAGIQEFVIRRDFVPVLSDSNALVVSQFPPETRWNGRNAMVRNRLICALAQAVLVVEAGQERDEQGRMSGTFDAGKTALELGVPLFVLDPATFDNPPPGNAELLERGGELARREGKFSQDLYEEIQAIQPKSEPKTARLF